jgi:hypothetical protein
MGITFEIYLLRTRLEYLMMDCEGLMLCDIEIFDCLIDKTDYS